MAPKRRPPFPLSTCARRATKVAGAMPRQCPLSRKDQLRSIGVFRRNAAPKVSSNLSHAHSKRALRFTTSFAFPPERLPLRVERRVDEQVVERGGLAAAVGRENGHRPARRESRRPNAQRADQQPRASSTGCAAASRNGSTGGSRSSRKQAPMLCFPYRNTAAAVGAAQGIAICAALAWRYAPRDARRTTTWCARRGAADRDRVS